MKLTAVITAEFYVRAEARQGGSRASLTLALTELLALRDLGVDRVLFIHDRRGRSGALAREVCAERRDELAEAGVELETLEVDAYETAQRWRFGIQDAFEQDCDGVFLFPGDIVGDSSPGNREGWRRMVQRFRAAAESGAAVLVLGDYDTSDSFKTDFDSLLVLPVVERIWGAETAEQAIRLRHSKLRTEVFIISREFYQSVDREGLVALGPDPTLQLILYGLRKGHSVLSQHFGRFSDNDGTRKPLGQLSQLLRILSAQCADRIWHVIVQSRALPPSSVLRVYRQLADDLERAFAATLGGARSNADRLERDIRFCECNKTSVQTTWSPFVGFSYLFDAPGEQHYKSLAPESRLLDCRLDASVPLFVHLDQAWAGLRQSLGDRFLLAALPSTSWHTTVWDGVNQDNCGSLSADAQVAFQDVLGRLPGSLSDLPYGELMAHEFGVELPAEGIRFCFDRLDIWGSEALVAALRPADERSESALQKIGDRRRALDDACRSAFGKPRNFDFAPHVSLGYFPNGRMADLAREEVHAAGVTLRAELGDAEISYPSIKLYAFNDMATFTTLPS